MEDLARQAGISRITLYRRIKSIKNQNTGQFIRDIEAKYQSGHEKVREWLEANNNL
jgi:AraC-like DNA-binding protein